MFSLIFHKVFFYFSVLFCVCLWGAGVFGVVFGDFGIFAGFVEGIQAKVLKLRQNWSKKFEIEAEMKQKIGNWCKTPERTTTFYPHQVGLYGGIPHYNYFITLLIYNGYVMCVKEDKQKKINNFYFFFVHPTTDYITRIKLIN